MLSFFDDCDAFQQVCPSCLLNVCLLWSRLYLFWIVVSIVSIETLGVGWIPLECCSKYYHPSEDPKAALLAHMRSHWNWIRTRCRDNPQTVTWTERYSVCQTTLSQHSSQWVMKGKKGQLGKIILECGSQRKITRNLWFFRNDLHDGTWLFFQ